MSRETRPFDYGLFFLLLLANVVSFITTLKGARQVLPEAAALMLAVVIQATLFLLMTGLAGSDRPIRRMIAIIPLTAIVVYTSIITYFNNLGGEVVRERRENGAQQAFSQSISHNFVPARDEYKKLVAEADRKGRDAEREEKLGLFGATRGRGAEYRRLRQEEEQLRQKAAPLKPFVERFTPDVEAVETRTKAFTPVELFQIANSIYSATPKAYRGEAQTPSRIDYVDEEAGVMLLLPIRELKQKNPAALVSLALALATDGLSVLLGAGLMRRKRSPGQRAAYQIRSLKQALATISAALRSPVKVDSKLFTADAALNEEGYTIELLLPGRASEFLEAFLKTIDPFDLAVSTDELARKGGGVFASATRMLLDALSAPNVGWVQRGNRKWVCTKDTYHHLGHWIRVNITEQKLKESRAKEADESMTLRLVRLVIPPTA